MDKTMDTLRRTRNRARLAAAYLRGDPRPAGLPLDLNIELTNRCDLSCVMCPRDACDRPLGEMDLALFRRVVDQALGGVELVNLCLAGEPLLYGRIVEAIAYLKRRGLFAYLQTNAHAIGERLAGRIIDSGLDAIIFSIDAATPATYGAIRGGGDYQRVVRNVEGFLALRRQRGRGPFCAVQFVVQRGNAHERAAFRRRWAGSGVDAVRFKPLTITPGKTARVARLAVAPPRPGPHPPCIRPFRALGVLWDGRAIACCHDLCGSTIVGDLGREDLAAVWRGEPLVELRRLQLQGRYDAIPLCRGCNRKNLNLPRAVTGLATLLVGSGQVVRRLPWLERRGIVS